MAYTATVVTDEPSAGKQRVGASAFGILAGVITLSNYNQTHAEITAITKQFLAAPRVIVDGLSSLGYLTRWDSTDKCVTAFVPGTPAGTISAPTITTGTNATTTAPLYTNGGALTQTTGAAGITGVQAPTFTGAAGGAAAEAANSTNIGTIKFIAIGQLG